MIRNVEQRMGPVRKIEYPQHSNIRGSSFLISSDRALKSILSKLWFAFWHRVVVARVVFYHVERLGNQAIGPGQMIGSYEIEIVCRGMMLGDLGEPATLKKSPWQVKPGRAVLALIVTVGEKVEDGRRQPRVTQSMGDGRPIDLGIATSALFVSWTAAISNHRDNKPMLDMLAIAESAGASRRTTRHGGYRRGNLRACYQDIPHLPQHHRQWRATDVAGNWCARYARDA
jgi:hypothetical protein